MIHVAVGIIQNNIGQVLIAERLLVKGQWEFPGGKVEVSETVFDALVRELQEEIAIQVISAEPWLQVSYDYGDKDVLLDCWKVNEFWGTPYGAENQAIQWVSIKDLTLFEFPAGNKYILEKLREV